MKLIRKGAEGDLFLTNWINQKAILKSRKKKDYRNTSLDYRLRKQRTIRESEIISEVKKFGIHAPLIYFVDVENCNIIMQKIDGVLVRDLSASKVVSVCSKIGKLVGIMHKNGIAHGDLTTSNFILSKHTIFIIDFGLASRTSKFDDHAVDLRLFKEILNSAHAEIFEKAWSNFLSGYKTSVGKERFTKVTNQVMVIESRGRYATVV
ncbi:Mn2+-dependent serine-threonine protein kinase Signal transduction [Marine Group I thaumarchaeote SCGC AAA799-D07]|nr:Mn2+-dependent serine-threonine protein kinase Signal transduction [Marine Group I thaumarchaeote SCGC AAA799-D07]